MPYYWTRPPTKVVDLTEAERIVAGGRSLKSKEQFDAVVRPLAAAVHATPGASRAAVDQGYAPHGDSIRFLPAKPLRLRDGDAAMR